MEDIVESIGRGTADASTTTLRSNCGINVAPLAVAAPTPCSPLPAVKAKEAEPTYSTATLSAMSTQRIALPWDLTTTQTELCRSCGKPHSDLHELFEEHHDATGNSDADERQSSSSSKNNDGNNNNNNNGKNITSISGIGESAAIAVTTETATNQQNSKMDNILHEMQIWQLGIKFNDGLPQRICPKCTAQFYIIGKFRRKCVKVQMRLHSLYEQHQFEEKKQYTDADMPPALDISNDLINGNYGQPIYDGELLESNWNNTQVTHSESLPQDLLVDGMTTKATKSSLNDAVNTVNTELMLQNVTPTTAHCTELILKSNSSLIINNTDLAIKVNTDEVNDATNINTKVQQDNTIITTEQSQTEEKQELTNKIPSVLEAGGNQKSTNEQIDATTIAEYNTIPLLISNQSSDNIADAEYVADDENRTTNNPLIIDFLDTRPSTSKQAIAASVSASNISNLDQRITAFGGTAYEEKCYKENQKDCCTLTKYVDNESRKEKRDDDEEEEEIERDVSAIKDEPQQQETEMETSINPQKSYDTPFSVSEYRAVDEKLTPSSSISPTNSIQFVRSKAAVKEYSSSPLCYDVARRSIDYKGGAAAAEAAIDAILECVNRSGSSNTNPTTLECQSANVDSSISLVSIERELLDSRSDAPAILTTTVATTETTAIATTNSATAPKRRKKSKSTTTSKSSKKVQQREKHSQSQHLSSKSDNELQLKECSVHLRRLSVSQLLNVHFYPQQQQQQPTQITGNEASSRNNERIKQKSYSIDAECDDSSVICKKPRLNFPTGTQPIKRRVSQWRTKAEMKANIVCVDMESSFVRAGNNDDKIFTTTQVGASQRSESQTIATATTTTTRAAIESQSTYVAEELTKQDDEQKQQHRLLVEATTTTTRPIVDLLECINSGSNTTPILSQNDVHKANNTKPLPKQRSAVESAGGSGGHQMKFKGWKQVKRLAKQKKVLQRTNIMKLRKRNDDYGEKEEAEEDEQSEGKRCGRGPLAGNITRPQKVKKSPRERREEEPDTATLSAINTCEDFEAAIDAVGGGGAGGDGAPIKTHLKKPSLLGKTKEEKEGNALNNLLEMKTAAPIEERKRNIQTEHNNAECTQRAMTTTTTTEVEASTTSIVLNTNTIPPTLADADASVGIVDECVVDLQATSTISCSMASQKQLIVRVPLAILTEQFQKLHFSAYSMDKDFFLSPKLKTVEHLTDPTAITDWLTAVDYRRGDGNYIGGDSVGGGGGAVLEGESKFCESVAVSEPCFENPLEAAAVIQTESQAQEEGESGGGKLGGGTAAAAAALIADTTFYASNSQNDSDQSEFYGFSPNESNTTPTFEAANVTDASSMKQCHTSVSSQINDYINDFQMNCLDAEDQEVEAGDENQSMLVARDDGGAAHMAAHNVMDNFVDNTLNGLLSQIQDQSIFSPSSTQIVTMESEDFHNHLVYSPSSDHSTAEQQAAITAAAAAAMQANNDYISRNHDLSDPGPAVNPSHIIQRIPIDVDVGVRVGVGVGVDVDVGAAGITAGHQCNTTTDLICNYNGKNYSTQMRHYSNYVDECFTEDSTQSELIGFQNDIPCFENFEINSSTPRGTTTATETSPIITPLTSTRTTNSSLQGSALTPQTNLPYLDPNNADDSALYCAGALNTQTLGANGDTTTATGFVSNLPPSANGKEKNGQMDNAEMHLTRIFSDLPLQSTSVAAAAAIGSSSSSNNTQFTPNSVTILSTPSQNSAKTLLSGSTTIAAVPASVSPRNAVLSNLKSASSETVRRALFNKINAPLNVEQIQQPNLAVQTENTAPLVVTQLPATSVAAQGASTSHINNVAKYTLYSTEMLPQGVQWQPTATAPIYDGQTTTTYYINAPELNQSNLISTTIAVAPLISSGNAVVVGGGGGSGVMGSHHSLTHPLASVCSGGGVGGPGSVYLRTRDLFNERSADATNNNNESSHQIIRNMQSQPIMLVYNNATNQLTFTPVQPTLTPTQLSANAITTLSGSGAPSAEVAASAAVTTATAVPIPMIRTSTSTPSPSPAPTIPTSPAVVVASPAPAVVTCQAAAHTSPPRPQLQKVNLTCRFCHNRPKFTNNVDYSNHIIGTHPGENPYNCPHCPMFFTRRTQRQQHIVEAHNANRFHCAQCGQSFCAQRTLDIHLQRFHKPGSETSSPQRSSTASAAATDEQQLVDVLPSTWHEHQQQTHASNHITAESNYAVKKSSPPHRILGCPDCDDCSFDDMTSVKSTPQLSHQATQHSHNQQQRTNSHDSAASAFEAAIPSPEQTEPDSTSSTTLRYFRKQRLTSKSSNCSSNNNNSNSINDTAATTERVLRNSHNCQLCNERFNNDSSLRKHQQAMHGNQTNFSFICSMCNRGFRMRTALQRHMETHDRTGRPFECSICLVRFPRPSQLTLHKLTVHFLRKPHACNICGKQFGTEGALKTHEKLHTAHRRMHIPLERHDDDEDVDNPASITASDQCEEQQRRQQQQQQEDDCQQHEAESAGDGDFDEAGNVFDGEDDHDDNADSVLNTISENIISVCENSI